MFLIDRQRDWYADDRNGNMYYFNICADANDVPESCQYLEKAVQAPVYQVSNESECFWLGQLRSMEWELIDENEPAAVCNAPSSHYASTFIFASPCAWPARLHQSFGTDTLL